MAKGSLNDKYIGKVVENIDPKRIGRIKVQVLGVNDNTKKEDLPWASPTKDGGGNSANIPNIGKLICVTFENGDINKPIFENAMHYDNNLNLKLSKLSPSDYTSFNSVMFDSKTQVFTNNSDGLIMDNKMTNFNINDNKMTLGLKDNYGIINLGTNDANQKAVLGTNFMEWFGRYLNCILKNTAYMDLFGVPVFASSEMIDLITEFKESVDNHYLSQNVLINDNDKVNKIYRETDGTVGDKWTSTVEDNNLTTKEPITFGPKDGTSKSTMEQPSITAKNETASVVTTNSTIPEKGTDDDVDILKKILTMKNYILYEDVNKVNIIAIRNQCVNINDMYKNKFVDDIYILYVSNDNMWICKRYNISTVPGTSFKISKRWAEDKNIQQIKNLNAYIGTNKEISTKSYLNILGNQGDADTKKGLKILVPSQYIDTFYESTYLGEKALLVKKGAKELVWRDTAVDKSNIFMPNNYSIPEEMIADGSIIDNTIKIHAGFVGNTRSLSVNNWSFGDIVFEKKIDLDDFFTLCETHKNIYGNSFTFTLCTKTDWQAADVLVKRDKEEDKKAVISNDNNDSTTLINKSISEIINNTKNGELFTTSNSISATFGSYSSTNIDTNNITDNGINDNSIQNSNEDNSTNIYDTYTIAMLNPTTADAKKITGMIHINLWNDAIENIGSLYNLSDNIPLVYKYKTSYKDIPDTKKIEDFLNDGLKILENKYAEKFKINIKLIWTANNKNLKK